ncbi:MAG TPA: hypothetical protein VGO56_11135 [Pyrinomonadaceae bacterium]|jgi:hypothetical protein|nr:hypothetical protein [Pyrinomonadaceae bacterium]
MATINSAVLVIDPGVNNQSDVIVDCQISIPNAELQHQFTIDCSVFGSDLIRDDLIFSYDTQFPFGNGFNPNVRFKKRVSNSALNEDRVGRDEVVGKVTLKNVTQNKTVKRNTSVVTV